MYSLPDKNGNQKLMKRNVVYKKQFETTSMHVEQHITKDGTISKKWCNLKVNDEFFRLNHRFEDIEKLTQPIKIEGFKRWS